MKKVILLVEDNPDDEGLTLRAMHKATSDAMVVSAYDGPGALAFLSSTAERKEGYFSAIPYLILLDLKLPGMSGLEVLRRIRKDARFEAIPVVMLTSSCQEGDILDAYSLGANGYLRKRVDYREFCRDIRHTLAYWLNLNRVPPGRIDFHPFPTLALHGMRH